jgi:hypothetical protein
MKREIIKTLDRHGKVIIPAFAVGRTQELVYNLNRMKDEHALPNVPVYVDSPLAVNVTDIFKRHPECYDEETARVIQQDGHPALEFANLTYIRSLEESKALNERRDPMIIISASGMAEFGRIVFHIRWNIENPRNTILIVSWQAPNTLGRRLADREERVSILGDMYPVKANIATIGGLSAHAGQNTLVEYGLGLKNSAKHTFLVHGEERGALPLMEKLKAGGLPNSAINSQADKLNDDDNDKLMNNSFNQMLSYEFNEEQENCLHYFDRWSPIEQTEFVENLLRRMCHFQHGHINNFLKPMLQRDFISSLPAKGLLSIAEMILSYLDAKSLCAAELVCKEWLRVISEGMLWKKLIEREVNSDPMWKGLSQHRGWAKYLFKNNIHFNQNTNSQDQHKFYKELYVKILKDKEVCICELLKRSWLSSILCILKIRDVFFFSNLG